MINLDEYADVGTRWISLFCNRSEIIYFNSFGVEHFAEKIKGFVGNKNFLSTSRQFSNVWVLLHWIH